MFLDLLSEKDQQCINAHKTPATINCNTGVTVAHDIAFIVNGQRYGYNGTLKDGSSIIKYINISDNEAASSASVEADGDSVSCEFVDDTGNLVMVEATGIRPEGRISPQCLGIWTDQQAQVLGELPNFAHKHGVKMGIQLAHAGRKASTSAPWLGGQPLAPEDGGWQTVAPSPIAFGNYPQPRELSTSEINQLRHLCQDHQN
jgi:hypothetical protein